MTTLSLASPVRILARLAGERARRHTIAALLAIGLVLCASSLWIYAKASLAQVLLEISWQGGGVAKPWPWADTRPVAKLKLERNGRSIVVLAGASGRTMAFGPGHLDGSAAPGANGNCVITAHRDTHFTALRYLVPGDVIALQKPDRTVAAYEVTETKVVESQDTSVLRQDGETRLTLITCYPFDAVIPGGPLRYVVIARPERSGSE